MGVLTLEQYQALRTKVIGVADSDLVGRSLMPTQNVDVGTQEYGYDKLTDMTAAEIISKFAPGSKVTIGITRKTASIPILHKGFKVSRIDLLSSNRAGQNIKAKGLERATRKIAELEDTIIFTGDADYGIKGIADVAGNEVVSPSDWSGTLDDSGNPYNDILQGKVALQSDGFKAKWLALNPVNAGEAMRKLPNMSGTWMDMIKAIIPKVVESPAVTLGTFFMGDQGEDIAELIVAEDYELLDANMPGMMVYEFDILDRVLPMFYEYGSVSGKSDACLLYTS